MRWTTANRSHANDPAKACKQKPWRYASLVVALIFDYYETANPIFKVQFGLGLCCTVRQKHLLLTANLVKNFF